MPQIYRSDLTKAAERALAEVQRKREERTNNTTRLKRWSERRSQHHGHHPVSAIQGALA